MGVLLLAVFIGVPLIEIAVFIEIGDLIGLWPTLGLVVLTALLGTWQLKAQGLATLARARAQVNRGALPTRALFDGACLLLAGALLLTPGFVTDAAGLLLFAPPLRDFLHQLLARHLRASVTTRVFVDGEEVRRGASAGPTIDGEYRDVTDRPRQNQAGERGSPDPAGDDPDRPRKPPR
ncbi:MAG: FxsA family protein [Kiloniellaceae bacterium]